ncbi:branched-chain amino acid transport system permease protein [Amycolatopsis bartoniae]|uniref:Branched-chain amino acid ABC transporter permease n=1 Tax=Amycolatopsis bartoniae TaxID=941986 RepID=A0A8H9MCA3_9PSEU|nr:branched-chain amino acid ABC transporter permease [Amycolatopsis bartoniae]MBB2937955.1 branched-chain amino acid transport system permease protein [Amycolatopsis bartoniae]TVT08557.1 branched-chain amino acid ABC transporter permease [Amycolatopsis bartoniae]GHF41946.1 branched-chain amino acid ABC transporter permease [Amycolatopsis bartoniae]
MQVFLQTLVGGLSFGAVYALVAMGFSIVYRTMGLVNFAHGQVVMVGAYAASTFYMSSKLPFILAIVVAMLVTGLIALVMERVLRPLENKDFDLMLIGTIGFGVVLESLATIIWGATGRAVPTPVGTEPLDVFGVRIRTYSLVVLGIAAVATVLLLLFLQRTKRGAAMQAVAMDHEAATAVGIHVGRSNAIAFAVGAGLAALAGGLVGPLLYVSPTLGGTLGIKGFAAAILGGFGNITGAIVGGLVIGVLDSFASGQFQGYSDLVVFLVFTVIVMVRPTGFFGERTVNRA